ncbi:MAG: hydrolase [Caulobacter sp.]|nr:hydrolase [Caulobacter sp.]
MRLFLLIGLLAALWTAAGQARAQPPPIRIILVGDSTVAKDSGWGNAFCADTTPDVTCLNMARGGRSTRSYRDAGTWAEVMAELHRAGPWKATYVLIQFGHNDQSTDPARHTDLATEFPANLSAYIREVRAAGATPILVTPLTRRKFTADGQVAPDLAPWAAATRAVAVREHVPLLDLYADSVTAIQGLGPDGAATLAMEGHPDATHLGSKGAALFSGMLERDLTREVPALSGVFHR